MTTDAATRDALIYVARRDLARSDFLAFLSYVRIEDVNRGVIPFEPWPHLMVMAQAWSQGQSEIVLKARQLGVSWLLAAFNLWTAMYRPGSFILELSQGQDEAIELLDKSRRLYRQLPEYLQVPTATDNTEELSFRGGGEIRALPSTEKAGRSYTATRVTADEAAFHPYARANFAAYQPTLASGGQLLMVSTSAGPMGLFHDQYWAAKRGQSKYDARFLNWRVRPGRDDKWLELERSTFVGLPVEFSREYPETDTDAFIALSGLVYPTFAEAKHVYPAPVAWEDTRYRVGAVDWGGGDPTVALPFGMQSSGHVHQYGEMYNRRPTTVTEIAEYLLRWHRRRAFLSIECGADEPNAIEELRSKGLPAVSADTRRGEGMGALSTLIDNDKFSIEPNCTESIAEFYEYRWSDRVDPHSKDRYATNTPVDHHGDAKDAERYAAIKLMSLVRHSGPVIQSRAIRTSRVRQTEKWKGTFA